MSLAPSLPGRRDPSSAENAVVRSASNKSVTAPVEWLVVAPHPDDATLIAAGVIARALRAGEGVAVAFMTNGDLTCERDGIVREGESVRALAELGLDEQHVYFLGYPDGYVARLGDAVLPPVERRIDGQCKRGNETYAVRGHDRRDVHSTWFGAPASYTAENAVTDLSVLLESLHPRQIIVTHPMDVHPDHAATYALLRRALAHTGSSATLHRAFVHTGDCWPLGPEPSEPCSPTVIEPDVPFPSLSGPLRDYHFTERIVVPDDFLRRDVDANPKLRAIRTFRSQLGPSPLASYLFGFSRRDEPFFVETPEALEADASQPVSVVLTRSVPYRTVSFARSAYRLAYAKDNTAVLSRVDGGAARTIKTWVLPHDFLRYRDEEPVELRFDARSRDGDVAEIALYVRHELAGVAVDVHPRLDTKRKAVSNSREPKRKGTITPGARG